MISALAAPLGRGQECAPPRSGFGPRTRLAIEVATLSARAAASYSLNAIAGPGDGPHPDRTPTRESRGTASCKQFQPLPRSSSRAEAWRAR